MRILLETRVSNGYVCQMVARKAYSMNGINLLVYSSLVVPFPSILQLFETGIPTLHSGKRLVLIRFFPFLDHDAHETVLFKTRAAWGEVVRNAPLIKRRAPAALSREHILLLDFLTFATAEAA